MTTEENTEENTDQGAGIDHSARLVVITAAQWSTLMDMAEDADYYRRGDGFCGDCEHDESGRCEDHRADDLRADEYAAVIDAIDANR